MSIESVSSANVQRAVPLFAVANMDASLRFYVDGLGFKLAKQWIDDGKLRWCWMELGSAALMLQEYRSEGHDSWVPAGRVGVGVSICFICTDALTIYRETVARGLQPTKPFVGNGMWVTTLIDPDSYRLDFESYTDAPEDSEFAEANE